MWEALLADFISCHYCLDSYNLLYQYMKWSKSLWVLKHFCYLIIAEMWNSVLAQNNKSTIVVPQNKLSRWRLQWLGPHWSPPTQGGGPPYTCCPHICLHLCWSREINAFSQVHKLIWHNFLKRRKKYIID